jgi:hypothetical protein
LPQAILEKIQDTFFQQRILQLVLSAGEFLADAALVKMCR